nr:hypothetical protein [uncultured Psychroserpens sp.]
MISALNAFREYVIDFASNSKSNPLLAAIASGLFPMAYYYNHNFFFVNSWEQFGFFVVTYLCIPIISFFLVYLLFKNVGALKPYLKYVIPILNFSTFSILIIISTKGLNSFLLLSAIAISIVAGFLLWKSVNKVIVFQCLLLLVIGFKLIPKLYANVTYSREWMDQDDAIEEVVFKKKPNIYVIQTDGYSSFSELKKGYYNYDNSNFESFLQRKGFTMYSNFRSNYFSTLSSNTSLFSMKHHYYNNPEKSANEITTARSIIAGANPVISIFNLNNYKTSLLVEKAYLLCNRPKLYYDYCNVDYKDLPYLARGFEFTIDIYKDLENAIDSNSTTANFYFVQKMLPRHISAFKRNSLGKEKERDKYFNNLESANTWLRKTIAMISDKDPNALIIMMADHGGFVGLDYVLQSRVKQTEDDILNSIFSSALAIKWPENFNVTEEDVNSSVNLFRVLFAHLSENKSYLEYLQDDKSFLIVQDGAPYGVYEAIDKNGNIVFNKVSN